MQTGSLFQGFSTFQELKKTFIIVCSQQTPQNGTHPATKIIVYSIKKFTSVPLIMRLKDSGQLQPIKQLTWQEYSLWNQLTLNAVTT